MDGDSKTEAPHISNHEVDENEVKEILRNPGEDLRGYNAVRVTIGQTQERWYV